MKPYTIEYNGKLSSDFNIALYDYPKFSGGTRNYDVTPVAGRAGELVGIDKYNENLNIECVFSIVSRYLMQKIRTLKEWLRDTGKLRMSDTAETFYKVIKVNYGAIERAMRKYGNFSVHFVCVPYEFRNDGQIEYISISQNPYDKCSPIYKIKGNGQCTLTVNGNSMTAKVDGNLVIDTDLMIAYKEGGILKNTAVTGNYELIRVAHGKVDISITKGFELRIIPNWGYEV